MCIEVKTSDDTLHPGLRYLIPRVQPVQAIQLVADLERARDVGGVQIRPLAPWLDELSSQFKGL